MSGHPYEIRVGHCLDLLAEIPDASVDCCVTSPPYWGLRDYGDPGQPWPDIAYRPLPGMPDVAVPASVEPLGLEREPYHYVAHLVAVFREVRRVLKRTGTLWLNLGDSYAGQAGGGQGKNGQRASRRFTAHVPAKGTGTMKRKDLVGIPWLVALALREDGWYLRQEIVWHKPNPMPESVRDRPTRSHEYLYLLAKGSRYYYDAAAVREPVTGGAKPRGRGVNPKAVAGAGEFRVRQNASFSAAISGVLVGARNRRSVWTVAPQPFSESHFAVMPPGVVRPCILAGCPPGGLVLDPFAGAGTTGLVAVTEARRFLGLEQSAEYAAMARARIDARPARQLGLEGVA
jgi:DNA modification methylase